MVALVEVVCTRTSVGEEGGTMCVCVCVCVCVCDDDDGGYAINTQTLYMSLYIFTPAYIAYMYIYTYVQHSI